MSDLYDALQWSLDVRAHHLRAYIRDARGAIPIEQRGLRAAMDLVSYYPDLALDDLKRQLRGVADTEHSIRSTLLALQGLSDVAALVEEWFSRSDAAFVPYSLTRTVEREARDLLGEREVVLSVGDPRNFVTFVDDLEGHVYGSLSSSSRPPDPIRGRKYTLIQVPRLEGGRALWRPVLSHELAHIALNENADSSVSTLGIVSEEEIQSIAPPSEIADPSIPASQIFSSVVTSWLEELICDAYALRRYGPSAVAALGEVLAAFGVGEASDTHPPTALRLELAIDALGRDNLTIVRPWKELSLRQYDSQAPWVNLAVQLVRDRVGGISEIVDSLTTDPYQWQAREATVEHLTAQLDAGIPECQVLEDGGGDSVTEADIVNAGWYSASKSSSVPIARLADKAVENLQFVDLWNEYSSTPAAIYEDRANATSAGSLGGVISALEIDRRISTKDESERLVVTPRMPSASQGAALDVRLGPHFIVFRKSQARSFDSLQTEVDPRSMQTRLERGWGQPLVLHPGQLVLAATLEYLRLPADVCAQVITRSSYGRLGLITATAVLVHPHFTGCLTLELVNSGEIPIELVPGERIAQLLFTRVVPSAESPEAKYNFPTRPEFSKVRDDHDLGPLQDMRNAYGKRES